MKKIESTPKNIILSLTLIFFTMSAAVGLVYSLTKDTIEQPGQKQEMIIAPVKNPDETDTVNVSVNSDKTDVINKMELSALKTPKKDSIIAPAKPLLIQYQDKSVFNGILPLFDNNPLNDFKIIDGLDVYTGRLNGKITGIAVTSFSDKGYNGKIIILAGFTVSGVINNITVIQQKETLGLGSKITEPEFIKQFSGKDPSLFKLLVKNENGNVDAVSGATVSSRAFCDAVQKAYDVFKKEWNKSE